MQVTVIAAIFVAIVGVVFAMQNSAPVSVDFFVWQFNSPLAVVLLLAVAFGAVMLALFTTPNTIRRQWIDSRQRKQIAILEKDLEYLKARIVELEANQPVVKPERRKPYVGLKEIALSKGTEPEENKDDKAM